MTIESVTVLNIKFLPNIFVRSVFPTLYIAKAVPTLGLDIPRDFGESVSKVDRKCLNFRHFGRNSSWVKGH